jgi:hypothetical protein
MAGLGIDLKYRKFEQSMLILAKFSAINLSSNINGDNFEVCISSNGYDL